MLKKVFALCLVLILVVGCLSACGSKALTVADVQKAGKLVIGTSPDFPPFESLNTNGKVEGIEIEILELICDELGVELEIKQMDFDSVLVGIQAAKYDCAMSGITVTPDRQKNMLFTDPYYNAAQVIVVAEGSPITGKADLNGKLASVQTGTTAESGCQDEGIDVQAFAANADAKTALTTGKVDAWVVDNLTAMQMVEDGDGLVILEEKLTEEPYAFAFAMGSEDLVAEINKALNELMADGTVEGIFANYGEAYMKP
jgi:polar amino acid transport system substrate-binding protein